MLLRLIERLDLHHVRLVVQDWGGLLGLTVPMACPERFAGLLVMNTALATGDVPLGEGFRQWRAYANSQPDLDIAALMRRACPGLGEAEAAAYDAPFPDARYKAGVRRFPNLVADHPEAGGAALAREAREWWRTQWQGRSFMAVGMQDPVLGPPVMAALRRVIRGCPEPFEVAEAGHFVQERGGPIAEAALRHFGCSRLSAADGPRHRREPSSFARAPFIVDLGIEPVALRPEARSHSRAVGWLRAICQHTGQVHAGVMVTHGRPFDGHRRADVGGRGLQWSSPPSCRPPAARGTR